MKGLPSGRREWAALGLRVGAVVFLFVLLGGYMTSMPGRSYSGPFQPLSDDELLIRDNLQRHVSTLAGEIGDRNVEKYKKLQASADYIEGVLRAQGYQPTEQEYQVEGKLVRNIETEVKGTSLPEEIVVVGAHYDSVLLSPGADDNATGVAALLELARLMKTKPTRKTIRFVAFVNEEPPYFRADNMGSRVYAKRARQRNEHVVAMLSLETMGYYSDAPRSQAYPLGGSLLYPRTGNFVAFVGNLASRGLVRRSVKTFRETTAFPSEGIAGPGWVAGIGWSDHSSFWKEGYPAVMVTDTAPFRYKHYHTEADTPDKIGYEHLARVVSGVLKVLQDLSGADNAGR